MRWLGAAATIAVTGILFVDLCDLLFDCGCRSLWAGLAEDCNIHHALGRHCPWCEHSLAGGMVAFGGVVGAQASLWLAPLSLSLRARGILALVAFPALGGAIGLVQGWWWGYWA